MEHKVKLGKNCADIDMIFTKEEWQASIEKSYKKNAGKYKIQGFRPGKAPRSVIEKTYGPVFEEDAIGDIFMGAYREVLKANPKIEPVDFPSLDFEHKDEGLIVKAKVDTQPAFELGKYTGHEIKGMEVKVLDEDVEQYLRQLAERRARKVDADEKHKIEKGDIATIDFVGSVKGIEFEGGKGEDYDLEIGSQSFIDTFEEQLIGLTVGSKKDVNVTFPENYHAKDLAGKGAKFAVTIKKIMCKEIPTIDEAFAKEVSKFDSLEAMKNDIRENLQKSSNEQAQQVTEDALIDQVVGATKVELLEKMVDKQLDFMMQDFEYKLAMQGATLELYAQYMGKTVEDIRKESRKSAENVLKTRLVFDAIAKKENISVEKTDIDAEIKRLAKQTGEKESAFKAEDRISYIEQDLSFRKVLEFLKTNNKIS